MEQLPTLAFTVVPPPEPTVVERRKRITNIYSGTVRQGADGMWYIIR